MTNKKSEVISFKKIEVYEAIIKVSDNSIMPHRTIKMYWDIEGNIIGHLDPLDEFPAINKAASFDVSS